MRKNKAYPMLWLQRGGVLEVILAPIGVWEHVEKVRNLQEQQMI